MLRLARSAALLLGLWLFSPLSGAGCGNGAREASDENAALQRQESDVLIYGATSSGIAAAVAAARNGASVILLDPGTHLGGMTAGGLGATDVGNANAIGGIAEEFYRRVDAKYRRSEQFFLEPHVADVVFREMLADVGVVVSENSALASVYKAGTRIKSVTTRDGRTLPAKVFIDATYEGDLLALSGAHYTVGREANAKYGETLNGVRSPVPPGPTRLDPYIVPGDPRSGLVPHVSPARAEAEGTADARVPAYNYRLCVTRDVANRVQILPPAGYRPEEFELVARWVNWDRANDRFADFVQLTPLPNGKFDMNASWFLSTDLVGGSDGYPEADEEKRAEIRLAHEDYMRGLLHFLATSPRIPEPLRAEASTYGLCADEFAASDNWPPQLYVREARRMVGAYVVTEHDARGDVRASDSVGLGSYQIDSHYTQRLAVDGGAMVEGGLAVAVPAPYPISYRALTPVRNEVANLLVPVCMSASHVAYSSIRMEPVFMILGHAAGTAAALAAEMRLPVQDVDYATLAAHLRNEGQLVHWLGANSVSLVANLPSPQPPGTPIVFTAQGEGSSDYRYQFWLLAPGDRYPVMVQDYGVGSTWTLPGTAASGTYVVTVHVRTFRDAYYDARADAPFVVQPSPATGVTLSASQPSPVVTGTAVEFTAAGQGSQGYEYRFWLRAMGSQDATMVQDYGVGATWTLPTTTPPGSYTVVVHVRTSPASAWDARAEASCTVRVPPATAVTLMPDLPAPQPAGTPITFTAAGAGSSGYEYRFWIRSGAGAAPILVQDYGPATTWTVPESMAPGTWAIIVHVRTSSLVSYDARAEVAYTLTSP